ncbi:hypothetical protein ETB97_002035 [Aspergillus alliaceus]|uniref:Helicase C-terminal domain-containing protein n=1 Tax=Petromyces alliaceus TaxID=209559 RepID=A0A8H6A4M7_PETAA|nr:hypothetical protein ETB97_002035 [Aspergillus burnettii]
MRKTPCEEDSRRVRPRLAEPDDWALNSTGSHLDPTTYPPDIPFPHSSVGQDIIFGNQFEPLPELDPISFDQDSFLQPIPDDIGLSGTSMISTPNVESSEGQGESLSSSMVDNSPNRHGEQICYGMLIHEKVKLVGKGQELEKKVGELKQNNRPIQVLRIRKSIGQPLFLKFPDGMDLGYLSQKMGQALQKLMELPLFEIDAITNLNTLSEALRRAGKPTDAATRVNINVYGRNSDSDRVGRDLSKKGLLQHPDGFPAEVEVLDTPPERDEDFEETIAEVFNSLRRGDHLTRLEGSETLNGALYPHQGEALDFMLQRETGLISDEYRLWQPKSAGRERLYYHVITGNEQGAQPDESGGGILADEMGMGKSLTTLVVIAKTLKDARQWADNKKAFPGASLAETPTRETLVIVPSRAHMIHRRSTTFHRAVVELTAKSRWCLSGTPIQNSLTNLGSLLAFIQLKPFHDPRNFGHWIANPFGARETKRKAIERLTLLLEAICLRQTIEMVDLPGQRLESRTIQFTPQERANDNKLDLKERRHCRLCESLKGPRFRAYGTSETSQRDGNGADDLEADGYSSKMRALISDVQSIIFSCWTRTLDLIARHLKASNIDFERIDGKTSTSQRQKILDKFDGTKTAPVLIMTTGTGAFGLNLQSVNRVFIVEPQWNPSVESQAIARAIRLGQEQ